MTSETSAEPESTKDPSISDFRKFIYEMLEGPIAEMSSQRDVGLGHSGNVFYIVMDGKEFSMTIKEVAE